ncbi:hypothetical protein AB0M36_28985 [Actinoplanes sp. NPDC051346]|uniref:hypothetical protein n=1 Tax=Actinoplanes sp. NPDC051346 TaxID=3155048 RepID=UPI003426449F
MSQDLSGHNVYGPGGEPPAGVDLTMGRGPWWIVIRVDPVWDHVTTMPVEGSDPNGGPGHGVSPPDGEVLLIVTSRRQGRRHPELDKTRHASAAAAMRTAWDAGLLDVFAFPT